MENKVFIIYDVCGLSPSLLRLLVHIADADGPGDWETYASAIFIKEGERVLCEYTVDEWITSMWQAPSGGCYAVSTDGHIFNNVSGKWKAMDLGKRYSLSQVWGVDEESIYCTGFHGVVFRKVDTGWKRFGIGQDEDLNVIGGTAPDDLYVLGDRGKMFFYDGVKWSEVDSPTDYQLLSILCISRDEVYVCGEEGAFFRGSRKGWQRIDEVDFDLNGLALYRGRVLVGGEDHGILAVDGTSLVPFERNVAASGLQVIGDRLFAFDYSVLQEFDGKSWSKTELDFASVKGNS